MSFEEAATIPDRLPDGVLRAEPPRPPREGERVLIHSATGGVGLAAMQLARRAGAEIFATAGTAEKRDFLGSLGVAHVMDSRSLAFADEVLEADRAARASTWCSTRWPARRSASGLSMLRDRGRFLEIGKRDIYAGTTPRARPFRKNLSLLRDRPRPPDARPAGAAVRAVPRAGARCSATGSLRPLPHRVFPVVERGGAFRYMAQAQAHRQGRGVDAGGRSGRRADGRRTAGVPGRRDLPDHRRARRLRTRGRRVAGRSAALATWSCSVAAAAHSPESVDAVERMRAIGAEVVIEKVDVADSDQLAAALGGIRESMPPLRGVLHAAMVLDDCLLNNLDRDRMSAVWGPKMRGAWNLHTLTLDDDLEVFVLFSSMSGVFGFPGQANYASANTVLDSLAYHRRATGRPGVTVSWGYLSEVGFIARHDDIAERLESMGVFGFTPVQALELLGRFMLDDAPHVGVMRVDWGRWAASGGIGSGFSAPRFAELVKRSVAGKTDGRRKGSALRRRCWPRNPPTAGRCSRHSCATRSRTCSARRRTGWRWTGR